MSPPTEPSHAAREPTPPVGRVAFEHLRERTDELELIISGLMAFALLAVPGRVFDAWAVHSIHAEGLVEYAMWFGFIVVAGLSYSLAVAFFVHLAIRGYWVSLIGLKSTFPEGIRWDRIPLMGSISQGFYRERIVDLGLTIDRADRAASILFAMAILIALVMVWVGLLAMAMILASGLLGMLFADAERATRILLVGFYVVLMAGSLVPALLEKIASRRAAGGAQNTGLARFTRGWLRVYGVVIPQRLILPVQATLQSNLNGKGFLAIYFLILFLTTLFGSFQIVQSARFATLHRYDVLTAEAAEAGMLGAHYESMRTEHDRLLRYPMIPSDRIAEAHLRLFLPHRPTRDNPLARANCAALEDGRNTAKVQAAAEIARACLATMWAVSLDSVAVPLDDFVPTERRDLEMRGLTGYLPVGDLAPGRHDLQVVWNPAGGKSGRSRRIEYRIPFWLSPGIEQASAEP
jgi:hypothetical protein